MNRKKFLTLLGIGGALLSIAPAKFFSTSFEQASANLIQRELDFLKIDKESLEKFIREYSVTKNKSYRLAIKGYSFFGIKSAQSGKVNQLVSSFLLSSDFFQNKLDENRVVKYVGLYNPYERPCSHPFSHIHFTS